jgi:hypothetical protein
MVNWGTRGPLTWDDPAPKLERPGEGARYEQLVVDALQKLGWSADLQPSVPGVDMLAYRPDGNGFVSIEVKAPPSRDGSWQLADTPSATDRDFTIFVEPGPAEAEPSYWVVPLKQAVAKLGSTTVSDEQMKPFRNRWDLLERALH